MSTTDTSRLSTNTIYVFLIFLSLYTYSLKPGCVSLKLFCCFIKIQITTILFDVPSYILLAHNNKK